MEKNTSVNKAVSLSMMIALGVLMANGAMADAQNKKEASRRTHDHESDKKGSGRVSQQSLRVVKRTEN